MSQKKNVLLLCGGGSSEHEVSIRSAEYFQNLLSKIDGINPIRVEIKKNGDRVLDNGAIVSLTKDGVLYHYDGGEELRLHYCIPCIHGAPGESGQIQALLEMMELPFYGPSFEASILCFNKISTKLWLKEASIPVTPFQLLKDRSEKSLKSAKSFFKQNNRDIYVKSTHQGSSVGCYHVTKDEDLQKKIEEAFNFSPYVLLEKTIKGRELEVATFNKKDKVFATHPGEIVCPEGFYSYEEKYSEKSETEIKVEADIPKEIAFKIIEYSKEAFQLLKLKDLARIDFFLTENNEIYLNEINTFPGHTTISMFPMMLENDGTKYIDYLKDKINSYARN